MQQDSDYPANHQVRRIIEIEKPFHPPPASTLTIVHPEQWDCQNRKQMQGAVDPVHKKEIDRSINPDILHHGSHLFLKIAPEPCDCHDGQHGDTAPVRAKGDESNQDKRPFFHPVFQFGMLNLKNSQSDKAPGKRSHNTGLVKYRCLEWEKWDSKGKIVAEVRDKCKEKQPAGIVPQVVGVVIALRDHKAKYGHGKSADCM